MRKRNMKMKMKMKKSAIFGAVALAICVITAHAYVERAYADASITVVNATKYTASIKVIQNVMHEETTLAPGGSWSYGAVSPYTFSRLEGTVSNPPWGSLTIVPRCVGSSSEGTNANCPQASGKSSWRIQFDAATSTFHFIKQ